MIKPKFKISIAICTYNRDSFLNKCLKSIYDNSSESKPIEILVIDNNSDDNTREIVEKYQHLYTNIKYILEVNLGLSYARNKAIKESNSEYIAFIDDDVKISDTYIERLLWEIDNYKFDCLGGMYYPWYLKGKPKWISKTFGQSEQFLDSIGELKSDYIAGGSMVFPVEVIKQLGGFPIELGMKGNEIRYGEEDYVQNKIRSNGGTIIFDPDLIVFHAVQKYKFSLLWRIKSSYKNSKSNFIIHYNNEGVINFVFQLIKSIVAGLIKRFPIGVYKILFNRDYYYQNLILETITPIMVNLGKISAFISLSRNGKKSRLNLIKADKTKRNLFKPIKNKNYQENNYKVTITICTYNRTLFLEKCLDSLFLYSADKKPIEIIVVDNNSIDNTKFLVRKYQKLYGNIKYFLEEKVGLSHARNRAIKESTTQNIAYLDDDVKVSESYLDRLLWIIDNYEYDCFGGMYYPWYLNEKPKWIPDDFGRKEKLLDSIGILKKDYVTGLNMVYTKEILQKIGGFPVDLGMIGEDIGYGEEDYVQHKIRQYGGEILFDPELYVFHAVLDFKQSLLWQLKSIYINSKTNFIIHRTNEKGIYLIFLLLKSIGGAILKRIPEGLFKIIFRKNYYYQNFILDVLKPILVILGKNIVYFT